MESIGQTISSREILQCILSNPFGIDVSGSFPVIRSKSEQHTLPLDSISSAGLLLLEARSREQYVNAVLTSDDSVEEMRGTLFFLAGEVARRNRRPRHTSSGDPAHLNRAKRRKSDRSVVAA